MRKAWHKADPQALLRLRTRILQEFPDLQVSVVDDSVFLSGRFSIAAKGKVQDSYEIEVRIPPDFPDSVPSLREIAGRIPMTADRHMNPPTGEACPIVPEEWLLDPRARSIISFLKGPVTNFFIGQSLVEAGDTWPFGERSHRRAGIIEYFSELFETADYAAVIGYLEILSRTGLKGHWICPCGSGKRLRDCHGTQLRALRLRMPRRVATRALQKLRLPG